MPPTCTPEKKEDYQRNESPIQTNELYFTRKEYDAVSPKPSDRREEHCHIGSLKQTFPELDRLFFLHRQVGYGTFSTVFLASLKGDETLQKRYAVKHIVPTCHPDRIKFELQCLKDIGGVDNVAGIDLCLRNRNNVIFIMPYQPHNCFNDYVGDMDAKETAMYIKNLLKAIARVHQFSIVHRDIKPSNFLYDRKNRRYLLVDFGLANSVVKRPSECDVNKKRKYDATSATSDEITQQVKRRNYTNDISRTTAQAQGNSQKENDPQAKKHHDIVKNLPQHSRSSKIFEKTTNQIVLTKLSPPSITTVRKSPSHQKNVQSCKCYGKPRTCTNCVLRKNLRALRAGTPGFRPPEVLLKSTEQDTGVDVWAAGVIMLSILSNCCNFFSSPDDMTALAEIITIFGFDAVKKVASLCGRYLICSEACVPLDLRKICRVLRSRSKVVKLDGVNNCTGCDQLEDVCVCRGKPFKLDVTDEFPDEAYDLLKQLLDVNPKLRISAVDALQHPFLKDGCFKSGDENEAPPSGVLTYQF